VGENGAGKTNLLEGIHVGTQGFLLRTRRDAAAVRFGDERARVAVSGRRGSGSPFATEITVERGGGKRATLDGAAVAAIDALRTSLPVLAFTPDRLAVVKGGPVVRRTFFDRAIGRLFPAWSELPGEYARALAQRNAALRQVRIRSSTSAAVIPWTELVVRLGTNLRRLRADVVSALAPRFRERAGELGLPHAALLYEPGELSAETLEARFDQDVERGATGAGPHLDDIGVKSENRDLRSYGSQGEQRAAVVALVLAEASVVHELRSDPPLLLLDDVLSELDAGRRSALVRAIPAGCQALVTATSVAALPPGAGEPAAVVDVAGGKAIRR
jgi:DNA replication and repair protein RecF